MTSIDNTDYWSLLGLSPDSSPEQLKRAFRREARKWHPDLNVNDLHAEERFKLVNEAYAVLSDPRKRKQWEEYTKNNNELFYQGFPDFSEYLETILDLSGSQARILRQGAITKEDLLQAVPDLHF